MWQLKGRKHSGKEEKTVNNNEREELTKISDPGYAFSTSLAT